MLALVAMPAGWTGFLALISFNGCLVECGAPEPGAGALWASVTAVLLALPVIVGLVVARIDIRRAWPWLAGSAGLVLLVVILAQRVV